MAAPYQYLNGTLAGQDLTYLFIYANSVTNGFFVLFMVLAFFIVVSVGSMVAQQRFSGRIRPEVGILVGSFATLGFEVILAQKNGLLSPFYIIITIIIFILSAIWVYMSNPFEA